VLDRRIRVPGIAARSVRPGLGGADYQCDPATENRRLRHQATKEHVKQSGRSWPWIPVAVLTAALVTGSCATDSNVFGSRTSVTASDPSRMTRSDV